MGLFKSIKKAFKSVVKAVTGTIGGLLGANTGNGMVFAAPAPAATPASTITPIEANQSSQTASEEEKKRRRAATGRSDTILTSGLGVLGGAKTGKTKLSGAA